MVGAEARQPDGPGQDPDGLLRRPRGRQDQPQRQPVLRPSAPGSPGLGLPLGRREHGACRVQAAGRVRGPGRRLAGADRGGGRRRQLARRRAVPARVGQGGARDPAGPQRAGRHPSPPGALPRSRDPRRVVRAGGALPGAVARAAGLRARDRAAGIRLGRRPPVRAGRRLGRGTGHGAAARPLRSSAAARGGPARGAADPAPARLRGGGDRAGHVPPLRRRFRAPGRGRQYWPPPAAPLPRGRGADHDAAGLLADRPAAEPGP